MTEMKEGRVKKVARWLRALDPGELFVWITVLSISAVFITLAFMVVRWGFGF